MALLETFTSVQSAFEHFEATVVRIPPSEDAAAQEVHPALRAHMRKALGPLLLEDFLSGSYSRRVQVAPRLRDIDIIFALADPTGAFAASATAALLALQAAAEGCDLISSTEVRCRSVRAYLSDYDFTVDLVAAREPSAQGLLLARRIPEEGHDDWTPGHPRGQKLAAFRKNDLCEGMYIPEVRIVKFWKNANCQAFRSYHAESVLYHSLPRSCALPEATARFFDAAYDRLAPEARTEDPGAPGVFVDERLEPDERQTARRAVDKARRDVFVAMTATSTVDALNAWARIFGPAFPAPANSRETLIDSLATRTAGVSGLGVTANRGNKTVQPRSWRVRG